MTKTHNQRFFSEDHTFLKRVAEDFAFIGRPHKLDLKHNMLTVFALPPRKPKGKGKAGRKEARNKRAESADRRA